MNTPIEIKKPLTEDEIKYRDRKRARLVNIVFTGMALLLTAIVSWSLFKTPPVNIIGYLSAGISFLVLQFALYLSLCGVFGMSEYWSIRTEDCGELLELCKQYPEINDYRLQVVLMNRQFTNQEFKYLRRLAFDLTLQRKNNIELEQCKELYKV